jgi:enterobactin synthetase component D
MASRALAPGRAFARDVPFGRLVGVTLPTEGEGEDGALAALEAAVSPEERAFAAGLRPARRATWLGGRVALRAALADIGVDAAPGEPILTTSRGGPALPAGVAGSISHKATLAVALAARADDATTLGVDLELDRAPRVDIGRRVLTAAERARLTSLSPEARARAVVVAFAAKEAIYKALDPWVGRYVAFTEVEVTRQEVGTGGLVATLDARAGEGPFSIELHEEPLDGFVVVTARVRSLP